MIRLVKNVLVAVAMAAAARKIWKRWSLATTDPSKFSNIARIEYLRARIKTMSTPSPMGIAMAIKCGMLMQEAGMVDPKAEKRRRKMKKKSNKRKPSRTRIPG